MIFNPTTGAGLPQSHRQRAQLASGQLASRTIEGLAAPFNAISRPFDDGTRARLLPGCFRDVVNQPCQLWVSHSDRITLASTADGTLKLSEQRDGLHAWAMLPENDHGRGARLAIARGHIEEMSLWFDAAPGCSRTFRENGYMIWEVSRVGWLREVSLAQWPRFPTTYVKCSPYRDQRDSDEEKRIKKFFQSL